MKRGDIVWLLTFNHAKSRVDGTRMTFVRSNEHQSFLYPEGGGKLGEWYPNDQVVSTKQHTKAVTRATVMFMAERERQIKSAQLALSRALQMVPAYDLELPQEVIEDDS